MGCCWEEDGMGGGPPGFNRCTGLVTVGGAEVAAVFDGRLETAAIAAAAACPIVCAVCGVADEAEAANAACKRRVLYERRG